jgi:DNA polymerase
MEGNPQSALKPQAGEVEPRFAELCARVGQCRRCVGMLRSSAVLGSGSGSPTADIVCVGEAPGRLGAARTGQPFDGDATGRNFQWLLDRVGLARDRLFVTNAVLCLPTRDGRNRRPTRREVTNCLSYLQECLRLIRPRVVVTLGSVALQAVNRLTAQSMRLADCLAQPTPARHFVRLALYHPSPRVVATRRSLAEQAADLSRVFDALRMAADLPSP